MIEPWSFISSYSAALRLVTFIIEIKKSDYATPIAGIRKCLSPTLIIDKVSLPNLEGSWLVLEEESIVVPHGTPENEPM